MHPLCVPLVEYNLDIRLRVTAVVVVIV